MVQQLTDSSLAAEDRAALADAVRRLECPTLPIKVAALIGDPITAGLKRLPPRAGEIIRTAAQSAIEKCLEIAVKSLPEGRGTQPANNLHKVAAAVSGAAGGAGGLATVLAELPISTTLMLRSIADVAQSQGENLSTTEGQLECVSVFALSRSSDDELGYYAVRATVASALREAVASLAEKGAARGSSTALVRFAGQVASRFGVTVSQKAAAQAVPILGAVSGAAINVAFTDAYQSLALGHFTVRRLERKYGAGAVRAEYDALKANLRC